MTQSEIYRAAAGRHYCLAARARCERARLYHLRNAQRFDRKADRALNAEIRLEQRSPQHG